MFFYNVEDRNVMQHHRIYIASYVTSKVQTTFEHVLCNNKGSFNRDKFNNLQTRTLEQIDNVNIPFKFWPIAGFYPDTVPVQKYFNVGKISRMVIQNQKTLVW